MLNTQHMQPINSNIPRDTVVFAVDDKTVQKVPLNTQQASNWLQKQCYTKQIIEELRSLNSSDLYFVPRIIETNMKDGYILEERITGQPLTESFIKTLSPEDIDIIYKGLAAFLNDINKLKPILTQYDLYLNKQNNVPLSSILQKLKNIGYNLDFDSINNLNKFYSNISKLDTSVVFAHKDINEHNLFYDINTKTLSVLDLAEAGYQDINYQFYTDCKRLNWLDVNKLITIYNKLPKQQTVIIEKNNNLFSIRLALYNIIAYCKTLLTIKPNTTLANSLVTNIKEELKKANKSSELFKTVNISIQKGIEY